VLDRFIGGFCRVLSWFMVLSLALMVVLVFTNVVMRYAFNSGITASEELSRWLFVWMTFMGAIVALRERAHLGTDTLVARLTPLGKKVCLGLSQVAILYICWLLFKGAWAQMVINLGTTSAVMEVSMALFYASGVVCAVLGGLIVLHDFGRLLTGRLAEGELVGTRVSDELAHTQNPKA
jgi:TRAP-type transport system small permease protein